MDRKRHLKTLSCETVSTVIESMRPNVQLMCNVVLYDYDLAERGEKTVRMPREKVLFVVLGAVF